MLRGAAAFLIRRTFIIAGTFDDGAGVVFARKMFRGIAAAIGIIGASIASGTIDDRALRLHTGKMFGGAAVGTLATILTRRAFILTFPIRKLTLIIPTDKMFRGGFAAFGIIFTSIRSFAFHQCALRTDAGEMLPCGAAAFFVAPTTGLPFAIHDGALRLYARQVRRLIRITFFIFLRTTALALALFTPTDASLFITHEMIFAIIIIIGTVGAT
jgi:hypothetical protein